MTVISDTMQSLGYAPDAGPLQFYARRLRTSADGTAIITPQWVHVGPNPSTGVFTTPDLDPGPAVVRIDGEQHDILIPDIGGTIALAPLLDAMVEPQLGTDITDFVRNGGGVMRIQRVTVSQYAAIATPDPQTFYAVVPD